MKTAGVRELKAKFSAYLRAVREGETVLVTDRGEVVAELRPPAAEDRDATPEERAYRDLVRRGTITPARNPHDRSWVRNLGLGAPAGTAQRLLDAEREE